LKIYKCVVTGVVTFIFFRCYTQTINSFQQNKGRPCGRNDRLPTERLCRTPSMLEWLVN